MHSLRAKYFPTQQSANSLVRCIGESKIYEFQKFLNLRDAFCSVNSIKSRRVIIPLKFAMQFLTYIIRLSE